MVQTEAVPRIVDLAQAAVAIPDAAVVGVGRLAPMSLALQLLRRNARDLHLVSAPTGGMVEEILIAGGAVRSLETSGVDLSEHGMAPAFTRAAQDGTVRIVDSSCPVMLMALQAGASGVSFTPVPGVIGSDLLPSRDDWKLVEDPFGDGNKVVLVPALAPDYVIVHGLRADPAGNLVTTIEFDDRLLIQAGRFVVATVEEISPDATRALAPDEQLIPGAYLDLLVEAPGGSLPMGCYGRWEDDSVAIHSYLIAARQPGTLKAHLDRLLA